MKIEKLEKSVLNQNAKVGKHDEEIQNIFKVLKKLLITNSEPRKKVGYKRKNEE